MEDENFLKYLENSMLKMDPKKFSEIQDQYLSAMQWQLQSGSLNPVPMSSFFPPSSHPDETFNEKAVTDQSFNINPLNLLEASEHARRRYKAEEEDDELMCEQEMTYSPLNNSFGDEPLLKSPTNEKQLAKNPEELPIMGAKKPFEQLLAEKLALEGQPNDYALTTKPQKREFLKRKTQVSVIPKAKPEYSKKPKEALYEPKKTKEIYDTHEESNKKEFLKRGQGKLCLQSENNNPKTNNEAKKRDKNETTNPKNKLGDTLKPGENHKNLKNNPKFKANVIKPEEGTKEVVKAYKEEKPPVRVKPKSPQKDTEQAKLSQRNYTEKEYLERNSSEKHEKYNFQKTERTNSEKQLKEKQKLVSKDRTPTQDEIEYDPSALELPVDLPSAVTEKLDKLNAEINRFQSETTHVKNLTKDIELKRKELEIEQQDFQEQRQQDLQELEEWKNTQIKLLKKERKQLEESCKPVAKKEDGEVDELKHTLIKLQEEAKVKEINHREILEQLKAQLELFNAENTQLEFEIKEMEHLRIKNSFKTTNKPKKNQPQEVVFKNGAKKRTFTDGRVIINFPNGDVKETLPNGTTIYNFFEDETTQTTFPDGVQLFEFSNGQTEKHFPDGKKEICLPDGSTKWIHP